MSLCEEDGDEHVRPKRSLRERLRREGLEDEVEIARVDGNLPVDVPAGSSVRFELALAAPPQDAARVLTGTLVIEGLVGSPRVEIPMLLLMGIATANADVKVGRESDVLAAGETKEQSVWIEVCPDICHRRGTGGPLSRIIPRTNMIRRRTGPIHHHYNYVTNFWRRCPS
jgi:hypothetical protein